MRWRKASFCNGATACVEVALPENGKVAVRDSKNPNGPVLVFTPEEWVAFVKGVKNNEFDVAEPSPVADKCSEMMEQWRLYQKIAKQVTP